MAAIRYKIVKVDDLGRRLSLLGYMLGPLFTLEYPEDTVVKAVKGSMGITTFTTLKAAVAYNAKAGIAYSKIIKVTGIGRGTRPKVVLKLWDPIAIAHSISARDIANWKKFKHIECAATESYWHMTKAKTSVRVTTFWPTPAGTMCYKAVKVID